MSLTAKKYFQRPQRAINSRISLESAPSSMLMAKSFGHNCSGRVSYLEDSKFYVRAPRCWCNVAVMSGILQVIYALVDRYVHFCLCMRSWKPQLVHARNRSDVSWLDSATLVQAFATDALLKVQQSITTWKLEERLFTGRLGTKARFARSPALEHAKAFEFAVLKNIAWEVCRFLHRGKRFTRSKSSCQI